MLLAPTTARAVDPNDSISLTGTQSTNGIYAGYPFALVGTFDDAETDSFDTSMDSEEVIFVPQSKNPSLTACPGDYSTFSSSWR